MTGIHDIRQFLRLQTIKPAEEKSSRGILGGRKYTGKTPESINAQRFLVHVIDFWNNAAPSQEDGQEKQRYEIIAGSVKASMHLTVTTSIKLP